jgi:hypothetical protein
LQEIKDEMESLIQEAKGLVARHGTRHDKDRAQSYWITPIENALSASFCGEGNMQETIDNLEPDFQEDEESETIES